MTPVPPIPAAAARWTRSPRSGSRTRRSRRSRSPSRGGSFRSRFRSSISTSRSRAPRRWPRRRRSPRAWRSRPDDARSAVRFAHDSATQNYVELEGGGRAAFGALVKGDRLRAVLVGRADLPAGRSERGHDPLPARRRAERLRPPRARDLCARRRDEGAFGRRGAHARRGARGGGLEGRSQAVHAARAVAADAAQRQGRPHVRLSARRNAGRGAHPAAARGRRRRAHRDRAVCARARIVRAAVPRAAQRERHDRGSRRPVGRAPLRARRLHPRRAVARAPALARRASRARRGFRRRRTDGGDDAVGGPDRLVRLRHRAIGDDLLAAAGRRGGGGRDRRRPRVCARVHGGGKPHAARVSPSAAVVARLVRRQAARRARCWDARSAATASCRSSSRSSPCFYYATNRWLGWWQPSEVADRSQHPLVRRAGADADRRLAAGGLHGGVPLSRGAAGARRAHRRALRAPARWASPSRSCCRRWSSAARTRTTRAFPSYSRLVELVLPSMLWAAIFLRFGLLPTILLHALFDLALFSIPLFLVDAPGACDAARCSCSRAALVPLGSRAVAAGQGGRVGRLAGSACATARGCRAPPAPVRAPERRVDQRPRAARTSSQRSLPYLGLAGLVAWLAFTPMRADVPAMALDRAAAEAAADAALKARGVTLGPEWRRFSTVRDASDDAQWTQHKFVWREAGAATYRALDRRHARAAALGGALRDVRRRRRGARRGMARHHRACRQGAPGAARAARGATGRAPLEGRGPRARRSVTCASTSARIPRR